MASNDVPMTDIEKGDVPRIPNERFDSGNSKSEELDLSLDTEEPLPPKEIPLPRWAKRVESLLGLEGRGIHRVEEAEQSPKTTLSFKNIVIMWLSINTASQNITLASIGNEVYGLGFTDAMLCSIFGGIVGTIPVAYTAGWGPWSGNRTMVGAEVSTCEFY